MTTCQWSIYICIILHVSASSQSARPILENTGNQNLLSYVFDQKLKRILLTGFSNIDNVFAGNQQIMQKC